MKGRLPNLVIAGTVKAGSTSLFSYLSHHPAICPSRVKESCHFLPLRYGEPLPPVAHYRALFPCPERPYAMEATPGYFEGGRPLAQALHQTLGEARILITLRDPAERLLSLFRYYQAQQQLPADWDLDDYVSACLRLSPRQLRRREYDPYRGVEGGRYAGALQAWLEEFGPERLRVVFFDELVAAPRALMDGLCDWLGLASAPYEGFRFRVENRTVLPRCGPLHRLAIRANGRLEPLLRRLPRAKHALRSAYYRLNGRADRPPRQELDRYQDLFADDRQALAALLQGLGQGPLPPWLRAEPACADPMTRTGHKSAGVFTR